MSRPALSASRAVAVLNFLASHSSEEFTLSGIAASLEINVASAHALLSVLRDAGYVVRHPRLRTYSLGPSVVALGSAALERHPAIDYARDEARRLSADLALGVAVTAVAGNEIVFLTRVGNHGPRDIDAYVGQRIPLLPPMGAIFVAWHDPDAWLARSEHRTAMEALLEEVRVRGWAAAAVSPNDYQVVGTLERDRTYNVLMVTAPVFGAAGETVVALTLLGLPPAIPAERLGGYGEQLRDAGLAATRRSGGRAPVST